MGRDTRREPQESPRSLRHPQDEQGVVLAVTLLVMILLSALGTALLSLAVAESSQSRLSENRVQAFQLAEAGQAYARRALSLNMDLDGDGVSDQTQIFTNNQPITWNSTALLASLQPGASGTVTIARHAADPELAVITSMATFGHATKATEPTVKRLFSAAPAAKAALTTNGPTATNGTIQIDGRDHDWNGILIMNNGTKGVFSASTYQQKGNSRVGGTDTATDPMFPVDYYVTKPGNPLVIETNMAPNNAAWDNLATAQVETMPTTPDAVLGFPNGTLKGVALSGTNGSQYATDPATLTFPLSGVTYVELPSSVVWQPVDFGDSRGILVVHNTNTDAVVKNLNSGLFRGLIIADDIVHIHTTIIGAVVSLTTAPSSGNVIGNGNGEILFSREALAKATAYSQKIWPTVSWREVR
ncbi:MAG: hypothetical protein ACE5IQ_05890 [Candidatus Methylomirabilales bacterium]